MGLDMYLDRYPRHKDFGPREIEVVESYLEWSGNPENKKYSFMEWCGSEAPKNEDVEALRPFCRERFWAWDDERRFPHNMIKEPVGYWRKANAIHKWFVDNVQDGEDDCDWHREVTEEDLEELRDACAKVLMSAVLMKGKVTNGYHLEGNNWEPIYEDGKIVVNPDVCENVLPCTSGCFFGSMEYNEWYIEDVKYTYELCCKLLKDTDFEKQQIYYHSSW